MVENVTNSDTLGGKRTRNGSKEIQLDRVIKPAVKGSWGAAENTYKTITSLMQTAFVKLMPLQNPVKVLPRLLQALEQ